MLALYAQGLLALGTSAILGDPGARYWRGAGWSWRVVRSTSGKEKLARGTGYWVLGGPGVKQSKSGKGWYWRGAGTWCVVLVLGPGVVRSKSIGYWRGIPRPVLERYWPAGRRVSRSPAVFEQYIKKLDNQELSERMEPFIAATPYAGQVAQLTPQQREWLMEAVREHMVCLKDIEHLLPLFFAEPSIEEEAQQVLRQPGVKEVLQTLDHKLPDEENPEAYRQCLKAVVKELKLKAKDVFMPARCALTGLVHGPDLHLIMAVWGRQETARRLDRF